MATPLVDAMLPVCVILFKCSRFMKDHSCTRFKRTGPTADMQPADDDACAAQPSSSPSWWSRTMLIARDSLAGTVGAFAKVMSGHPLDTLKVRMQTSTQRTALAPSATIGATLNAVAGISSPLGSFSTLSGAARLTWRTEGISGFYRGLSPTLPGVFMYNAALFAAYGQFELAAIQYNATRQASIECNDGRRGALPSVSMLPSVAQIGLIGVRCAPKEITRTSSIHIHFELVL